MESKINLISKKMQTLVEKSILRSFSKVTDLGESQHVQPLQNSVSGKMHFLKTGSSPIFFSLFLSYVGLVKSLYGSSTGGSSLKPSTFNCTLKMARATRSMNA